MKHVMSRIKSPIFKITFTSLILSGQLPLYLLTHLLHKEAMLAESGSIPLQNWIFSELDFLANSKSNSGIGIELALPSPGRIGIELELPSFELESELRYSELNSELPSWN